MKAEFKYSLGCGVVTFLAVGLFYWVCQRELQPRETVHRRGAEAQREEEIYAVSNRLVELHTQFLRVSNDQSWHAYMVNLATNVLGAAIRNLQEEWSLQHEIDLKGMEYMDARVKELQAATNVLMQELKFQRVDGRLLRQVDRIAVDQLDHRLSDEIQQLKMQLGNPPSKIP